MTIRPNKRRFAIGFYLWTGWLPWGVHLGERPPNPRVQQIRKDYWPLCCGHVLRDGEVQAWLEAGLLTEAPPATWAHDGSQHRVVVAGPQLAGWLSAAWHALQVRSWDR